MWVSSLRSGPNDPRRFLFHAASSSDCREREGSRDGGLLRRRTEPNDEPAAAPKLYVVTSDKALGPFDCLSIVGANPRVEPHEMPVKVNGIRAIFWHLQSPSDEPYRSLRMRAAGSSMGSVAQNRAPDAVAVMHLGRKIKRPLRRGLSLVDGSGRSGRYRFSPPLVCADLYGLHPGLSFGARLEHLAVTNNDSRFGGRP